MLSTAYNFAVIVVLSIHFYALIVRLLVSSCKQSSSIIVDSELFVIWLMIKLYTIIQAPNTHTHTFPMWIQNQKVHDECKQFMRWNLTVQQESK